MIRFNNDCCCGVHPAVLKALEETNAQRDPGYGADDWCARAAGAVRELAAAPSAEVHFFPGATQANDVIASAGLFHGERARGRHGAYFLP